MIQQSENTSLRRLKDTDCKRLVELANNENISKNLRDRFPYPYTEKDAKEFIQKCVGQNPVTFFAIEHDREYVGNIGLISGQDIYRKSAELGYFIGEPYWNKGIATAAINLITDHGFKNLNFVRIFAKIFDHNTSSQRVMEKCHFVKEGVFKKAVFKNGQFYDEIFYAKTC